MNEIRPLTLAPPAVRALREQAADAAPNRGGMERTISQDMREEQQDLKQAAEHSLNIILDLDLHGKIRYVSPSWKDVVGSLPSHVVGKPVVDILYAGADGLAETIESVRKYDSRSHIARFSVRLGPHSLLRKKRSRAAADYGQDMPLSPTEPGDDDEQVLSLEAQGIMVYDRATGAESHTMWMVRPSVLREVTIDLPEVLVESLGVGAEVLAHYLTGLAEQGANDPGMHPPPLPVLCRICERQITPWWFEKHSELCLQEHRAEMDVQMAQETLAEHRNAIVKVLDTLEAQSQRSRAVSTDLAQSLPMIEYKGMIIHPSSTPSSGTPSGRNSPASPPARSRERPAGFGHHRARSFAVRRPLARIVELVLDLCDTALEVNTPAIKENARAQSASEIRTQSPQSENRISQVLQWQSPTSGSQDHGEGLRVLCEDTNALAKAKIDAVFRHRQILEYSERIRVEFDILVQECIEAAIVKAARIAAGEDSSSEDEQHDVETPSDVNSIPTGEEGIFPGSFDAPSAIAHALRNAPDVPLPPRLARRGSSVATSNRSNSPQGGSQTPRSYAGAISIVHQNKRHSMHFESDAGADSDTSLRSSVLSGPRRADSPASEMSLSRVASSRERKRKSLVLPSVMSSRQQSPARSMVPPSSPLRTTKPRLPSGIEGLQSPITSPIHAASEFSSPAMTHSLINHHRRQSSAAGSDGPRPVSPRLMPTTQPQPRAVPPSIKDFEIIKPISKGAFGSVYLVKKKSTGEYYAIKVLKKADMVAKNQVTNVKAERAIMMWQGESDFVAKLYWTFSSKDYLYLVMEYLNGGDCASLIKVLGALPEDWAMKYLAEVVLGVEHLHSRSIVHRDLKPDNLLIDPKGHLKLTDFGLSRMGMIGRQKNALKSDEPAPDLLKSGPFHRATSVGSSRSASFDLNPSPSNTPSMTPALAGDLGQPSYFSLNKESSQGRDPSRRTSGNRSDSTDSEALQAMFRRFSIVDDQFGQPPRTRSPIEEETYSEDGSPYLFPIAPSMSQSSLAQNMSLPFSSAMPPPPMALFDPEDSNRRFVGTPDYLAPETIAGSGQDEVSDWWSLGCILFECLYGYPPFHADTPDEVFENILSRTIDWPEEDEETCQISDEAKDLINRLLCSDPTKRLGANAGHKFASGGEEIRNHPWFEDINWDTLRDDEASFIPAPENPEDTEYFDTRGAAMANFTPEFEDQGTSSAGTPSADYPDRPHDALSRVRSQISVTTMKRGLIPLHIPAHVREGRTRRLSEPVAADDFGSFSYKNLPVLEKANKDVIQKLRAEAMLPQNKPGSVLHSPSIASSSPSLETSPLIHGPLKRTLSTNKATGRPSSPSISGNNSSPSRGSQPSSPLLVQFSTGQNHERRKTSSTSSSLSHSTSNPSSLQPGSFFDATRLSGLRPSSEAISPSRLGISPSTVPTHPAEKLAPRQRQASISQSGVGSPRARSQTVGSQDGEVVRDLLPGHHKRRSQVLDISPSSSDTEDSRAKALLRVQRRRQSSRRLSQITFGEGPFFRPLDVLICEDHPVSRLVMEKLLEKLRCRTLSVTNGSEAIRYAMGEVKFDVIMMEFRLPQVNGADVARMIRDTKNANTNTPIVAVTGYLKELQAPHYFDALIEKPPTVAKLSETLGRLCQWKAPPPNWVPSQIHPSILPSGLRKESTRQEDSPTSNASTFPLAPSGSYRGSSRQDSISSSFFGDSESRAGEDAHVARHSTEEWRERDISRAMGGLGISDEADGLDLKDDAHKHVSPPPLQHTDSAPAALEFATIRRQRSAEQVGAKRRLLETRKHESAESGDDEDDELGHFSVRTNKSPKSRPKSSSKLGIEMMRTNSRGSVISIEDICAQDSSLVSSPPPAITEDRMAEEREGDLSTHDVPHMSLIPPEIFPAIPGDQVAEIEMDTPKASHQKQATTPDPDPTPRANSVRDA
ncbi:serine threonine protein kinase-like protein [Dothidotthia symphoricarpi CBS 119687]|uniref:non-specific serine/threonine protein kinase n=1 Tax=Dothidotthia symphoricarpi CBS 119687 TaxID=1392245 RepID=A0A6A6APQ0_9PLEO|nr:serine threonine protein kinase-like protein [Dothidotthia symphoricarpi CBS 119687]KAF2132995.1 serine threonine protein kinase-like protein [Dothidotthia symphoricarpi CBS 119687]